MALDWKTLEKVCVGRHSCKVTGGSILFPKDYSCEVILWRKNSDGEQPFKDDKLAYKYDGWPFRYDKEWKGRIAIDGNEALFAGKGRKGEVKINQAAYPIEVVLGWTGQSKIRFFFGKQEWVSVYPSMLMTEGDREIDKLVDFVSGPNAFQLCIFPEEEYIEHFNPYDKRPTAIAAKTLAIVEDAACLPHNSTDFPLLCLTVGLLGFEFFG